MQALFAIGLFTVVILQNVINDVIAVARVVVGDWLEPLKQFQDLHIFRRANKYANEPETILKQS